MIQIDVHINKWSMAKTIKLVKWRGVDSSLALYRNQSVFRRPHPNSLWYLVLHISRSRAAITFTPIYSHGKYMHPNPITPPKLFFSLFFFLCSVANAFTFRQITFRALEQPQPRRCKFSFFGQTWALEKLHFVSIQSETKAHRHGILDKLTHSLATQR